MSAITFHTDTAFARGLRELFGGLEKRLALRQPLTAYLAGGMAVHLYTGKRVTARCRCAGSRDGKVARRRRALRVGVALSPL
ncbi:MAG: hypothetical protein WCZ65_12285 [Lysobacteraceae bacterium]